MQEHTVNKDIRYNLNPGIGRENRDNMEPLTEKFIFEAGKGAILSSLPLPCMTRRAIMGVLCVTQSFHYPKQLFCFVIYYWQCDW